MSTDPFSNVGWFKHIKDTQRRSKGVKKRTKKTVKKEKMLAVQQAELLAKHIGEAWTNSDDIRHEQETVPPKTNK